MHSFTLTRDFRGRSITAAVTDTGQGVQVLLSGGDTPHIGAVGVLSPDGKIPLPSFLPTVRAFCAANGAAPFGMWGLHRLLFRRGCIMMLPPQRKFKV